MICVMSVANDKCHVVRKIGKWNLAVSRMYLLNKMTLELSAIHALELVSISIGKLAITSSSQDSRNVNGRVDARLCRLGLFNRWIDDWKHGS